MKSSSQTAPRPSSGANKNPFTTTTATASTGVRRSVQSSTRSSVYQGTGRRGPGGSRFTASSARDEAQRRANELRPEVETAIHVLDNGVNRTPLPLQRHGGAGGGFAGRGGQRDMSVMTGGGGAMTTADSSIFHSSFLMSSDAHTASGGAGGSMWRQQGLARAGGGGGSLSYGQRSSASLDTSMQSLSMMDRRQSEWSESQVSSSGGQSAAAALLNAAGGGGGGGGADLSHLITQQTLLSAATAEPRKPLTEAERRAWVAARTTVTLTETPVISLFSHQDELVSNEAHAELEAVQERNELYEEVEETFRTDEGTKFQSRGTITFTAPKKSIHSEVHPPAKADSGALQVTPWMLRDAFAPLLEEADVADGTAGGPDGDGGAEHGDSESDEDSDAAQLDDELNEESMTDANSLSDDQSMLRGGDGAGGGGGSSQQWVFAESLLSNLRVMERAVVQNYMERVQLAYRGIEMDPACERHGTGPQAASTTTAATSKTAAASASTAVGVPLTENGAEHVTRPGQPPAAQRSDNAATDPGNPLAHTRSGDGTGGGAHGVGGGGGGTAPGHADDAHLVNDSSEQAAGGTANGAAAAATAAGGAPTASNEPVIHMTEDMMLLWRYHSPLTQGRSVTCMAWNRKEPDILAVGYSAPRHGNATTGAVANANTNKAELRGMVCCWSLKNPLAPELVLPLTSDASVSTLAFSFEHPSLLAVGDTSGGIVVYDIHKDTVAPSITTASSAGLHTGAVWEMKWQARGKERGEFLMSIAADGRVVQWAVGKTIEKIAPDLMHLKRQPGTTVEPAFVEGVSAALAAGEGAGNTTAAGNGGGGKPARRRANEDALLSRQNGGMCFDVSPVDSAVYVVGTEDGAVFQCNKSQTENYDLEYLPHSELVYRVRWSPYSAQHFLTCSADWTTRLYQLGHIAPALRFDSPNLDAVQDVAWSYCNSLCFATVTAQGNVEVWSVVDTVYPRSTVQFEDHRRLNCVLFAEQDTPVVVVGDEEGEVAVFLLKGSAYTRQDLTDDEQEHWLEEAIRQQMT